MPSIRFGLVAALAIVCHGAVAQTVVPPTVSVQQIAPQLALFAGSPANFQSLVTGLAQGTPVQLTTVLPNGLTQVVTFTPSAPMSPLQIAQTLETARQQLIGLGIATPTGEQVGVALTGGVVPTALGGSQVPGLLGPQSPPSPAAQIQANTAPGAAAGATSATPGAASTSLANPPVNVQLLPATITPVATGTEVAAPRINTSDSAFAPGATSRSPAPTTPVVPGAAAVAGTGGPERAAVTAPAAPAAQPTQPAHPGFGSATIRR